MKPLEKLFGLSDEGSDLDRLEKIDELLDAGEIEGAIAELEKIRKDENLYVGAKMIVKHLFNSELSPNEVVGYLKTLIPIVNSLSSWRYRATLLADIAMAFYRVGDDFNGDLALKTAINLAYNSGEEVLVEILRELIRNGFLEKGAYAFSLVKDRKRIDFLLSQLAEFFYLYGDYEKVQKVLSAIEDPFYRVITLYRLALLEAPRDRDKALALLEKAIDNAEKIENRHARLELLIKLNDLKAELTGEGVRLVDILKRSSPPEYGGNADNEDQY
ncbi:hypothetical protein X802_08325 [Thermococcus guaymasensis DSM 11113]|uniref:Uncharacterized protein n=1 Tax=Thermococcus guaymasensis DSM 11113 TaxID=1432656 RepID=A0A0X1KLR0_9EURY|nr:hypothetical protein [Thermococcus guaymasensis]AJC72165.1 hypothetical protein X802_08325 [Thermococcus guaymasensis DSM 11113]